MEHQNVTLSLPKDVLRKFKHIAIEKNTSLSGLLTETIMRIVAESDRYKLAARENIVLMEEGFNLGTRGRIESKREELYER